MTKKQLKLKIKIELKSLAKDIRTGKSLRKPKNQTGASEKDLTKLNRLERNRDSYSHKHIAYCSLFNNTPYYMIECPRKINKPRKYSLETYKKKWGALIDEETICLSA